jgi:hypothetical protein
MRHSLLVGALACALASTVAVAQDVPVAGTQAPPTVAAIPAPAPVADCCTVAAGTAIELEIAEALDSSKQKRGDKFAIALHAPVYVGDRVLIPAGTRGVGEIVHAERSRGGGKPGELIVAARYLELDGQRIALRGMRVGANGKDKSGTALALSMAVGPFAHFVHGGEVQIPVGTLADAKIAAAFSMTQPATDVPVTAPSADAPVADAPATQASADAAPESTNAVSKE